jgi:hypothetical protein
MHFWTGGVGKDAVIFFALTSFIYALSNPTRHLPAIIFAFYLAYFIRPHIALLMLVGFAFSLLVSSKGVSAFWRVIFLASSVFVFFAISPAVFDFIGLDDEAIGNFEDITEVRSKNLSRSKVGSAIDINDYPVPLKILTFMFRPLFFDSTNAFGLLVSFENLFYVILLFAVSRWRAIKHLIAMPIFLKSALFILFSTAFFMSSSLGNLGIIVRQKNMVMFMFVLICVHLLASHQLSTLSSVRHAQAQARRRLPLRSSKIANPANPKNF